MPVSLVRGFAVALLLILARDAGASCVMVMNQHACDLLATSPVAFRGRVASVTRALEEISPGRIRVRIITRIAVSEVFAGDLGATVEVDYRDTMNTADTTFSFEEGKEYLVFGHDEPGRGLSVSGCSGTVLVENADPYLLPELRALKNVRGPGAVVRGRVEVNWPRYPAVADFMPPTFGGVMVNVRSDSHSASAVSRADGSFEIAGLPIGDYYFEIETPPGTYREKFGDYPDFIVRNTNGCVTRQVTLGYDGRILGRLVNRDGRALIGVRVRAMAADPDEPLGMNEGQTHTDQTGAFEIAHLDPGRYIVGVGGATLYAPGVDRREQAVEVDVAPGARAELDKDFQAPTNLIAVSLTGIVLDGEGLPVPAATVQATGGLGTFDLVETADDGRFRLTVLAAEAYVVKVEHIMSTPPILFGEVRTSVPHPERSRELTLVVRHQGR